MIAIEKKNCLDLQNFLRSPDSVFSVRKEWKFVLPEKFLPEIAQFLRRDFRVGAIDEEFIFNYRNVYFDTADFAFFRQHRAGRLKRLKLRVREYLNGRANVFLECKEKVAPRKMIKKRKRIPFDWEKNWREIFPPDFAANKLQKFNLQISDLKPVAEVSYRRINFIAKNSRSRVSIDFKITTKIGGRNFKIAPQFLILEIKTQKYPCEICQFLLRKFAARETKFSKYCVALCAAGATRPAIFKPLLRQFPSEEI